MCVLQDLYNSEINFTISTFWDGGFDLKIGDEMNGFKVEGHVDFAGLIGPWFIEAALAEYPDSKFAAMYAGGRNGLREYNLMQEARAAEWHAANPKATQP